MESPEGLSLQGSVSTDRMGRGRWRVLTPPSWPVALPISQRAAEEDKAWRDLQAQWDLQGLALFHSPVLLEATVSTMISHAEVNLSTAFATIH